MGHDDLRKELPGLQSEKTNQLPLWQQGDDGRVLVFARILLLLPGLWPPYPRMWGDGTDGLLPHVA